MEPLLLLCPLRLWPESNEVTRAFDKAGIRYEYLRDKPKDGQLVLLLIDLITTPVEIFSSFPWLGEQYVFSSLKSLRLMPFLIYNSSKGDIETLYEESLAEAMDAIISGEFKPFGFDLDSDDPLREFPSVLESYSE